MAESDLPAYVPERYLEYLDRLRESGVTNMWGAVPYLQSAFADLTDRDQTRDILLYWVEMRSGGLR